MEKDEHLDLLIPRWAAPQSFLWLWAANSKDRSTGEPILQVAFELLEQWGYTFYTMITWNKRTGPCLFGPYQVVTEHIVFGYGGKAEFPKDSLGKLQTYVTETPTVHSAKPDSFYQVIAQHFAGNRLDVSARQKRQGFDGWGNEYDHLDKTARCRKS